ncbi:MAG: hypothetical protein U9P68_00380 [Pseudomonadota bacterium]|nr:hypothetical protein [Pseudomonadota bacterium]
MQQKPKVDVPPPPTSAGDNPSWADDKKAKKEEQYWSDPDKLQGLEHRNQAWVLHVYGILVPAFMIFFSIIFIASLGVWVWHHITPWTFLQPAQLEKIQSIVFSGTLGAIVSAYAQRHMNGGKT